MVDDYSTAKPDDYPDRSVLFERFESIATPLLVGLTLYVAAHDPASIYPSTIQEPWGGGWIAPLLALVNLVLWFALAPLPLKRESILKITRIPLVPALAGAFFVVYGFGYASAVHAPITLWIQLVTSCTSTVLLAYFMFGRGRSGSSLLRGLTLGGVGICVEALIHLFSRVETPNQLIAFTGNRMASGDPYLANRLGNGALPYPTLLVSPLLVFASIALGLAVAEKRVPYRVLATLAYLLNGVCMWLTASRGGVILLVLLSLSHLGISAIGARKSTGYNKSLAGFAAAAIVLFSGIVLKLGLTKGSVLRADGSLGSRVHMWRVCWRIFKQNPITGGGPGAFREAWLAYTRKVGFPAYVVPHSLYFGILSEGGLMLFAGAAVLFVSMVWETWKAVRSAIHVDERRLLLAFAIGILAVLVHDLNENSFQMHAMYLLSCTFAGMAAGISQKVRQHPSEPMLVV